MTYRERWGRERTRKADGSRHRARRRAIAEQLAAERANRTDEEQLRLLDDRPGESRKERARLMLRLFR